jgi:uncharacterized membrane protein
VQGTKRKIVYVICFEVLAILLSSTLLKLLTDSPVTYAGAAAAAASAIAMSWNLAYNAMFEAWESRQARKGRSFLRRAAHVLGFEAGLVTMLVPPFAWILGVSLLQALLLNMAMILFFLAYGFLFNLVFDRIFGLPLSAQAS